MGDGDNPVSLISPVTDHDSINIPGRACADEQRAVRAQRHRPGVANVIGEDADVKPRRQFDLLKRQGQTAYRPGTEGSHEDP
jgi:hypothetical protein